MKYFTRYSVGQIKNLVYIIAHISKGVKYYVKKIAKGETMRILVYKNKMEE